MLKPFLQSFSEFLKQKSGNDVVLLLQNEQDRMEALLQVVEGLPFRTLIINAGDNNSNFVKRLKDLRPSPSYYAVLAGGSNMNTIYEKVTNFFALLLMFMYMYVYFYTICMYVCSCLKATFSCATRNGI